MQFTGVSSIQGIIGFMIGDMSGLQIMALVVTIAWSMLQIKKLVRESRNTKKVS